MRVKLPSLQNGVAEVRELLLFVASPLLAADAQITLLIDGLDRLIQPQRFREFAEQDLQALKGTKISVIIAAPLLMWYDKTRFLQDYFDVVKHIPAAAAGPEDVAFLKSVLERRGALEIMHSGEVSSIAKYSGGVLRDLLTLARTAAENAYRDDEDCITRRHVNTAIKQLGNRYLGGLGNPQKMRLRRLSMEGIFRTDDPASQELLVNRQVVEYVKAGREHFLVHPALGKLLAKPE
jgi:hypothetical protein